MPIGSLIGGIISGNGAAAAGNSAYNNSAALNATNSSGFSPYMMTGPAANSQLSALLGQGYLTWDGNQYNGHFNEAGNANDQASAEARATSAIKGGPLLSLSQPYLDQYANNVGTSFQASPSYNFRLQQGQNALANSASARGMTLSGPQAKALTDYNQNSASQEYSNWLNNYQNYVNTALGVNNNAVNSYMNSLSGLSGQGLNAASSSASARNSAMVPGINAQASGQAQQANALGTGLASSLNNIGSLAAFGLGGGFNGLFSGATNAGATAAGATPLAASPYDGTYSLGAMGGGGWR